MIKISLCSRCSVFFLTVCFLASAPVFASKQAAEPPASYKFVFGPRKAAAGYIQVLPATAYSSGLGYGFDLGSKVTCVERGGDDALRGGFCTSDQPFYFSVALPEGNYRVTITLGDQAGESVTTVKAESRRLMLEKVRTADGAFATRTFTVNVRNSRLTPPPANAPGGSEIRLNDRERGVLHWDDKLTLEFSNTRPCVAAVEIHKADDIPTVFLAGDSTVTDQPQEPTTSWGQMLTRFFNAGAAIANHAESGETLKSFITGLRLDKILSQIKSGDYLFIQFGHNDMKENWPQTYVEPHTTYKAYLRVFIGETRRRGAIPVLVTSMHRRNFDAKGKIVNTLGNYPEAVRQTAKEEKVSLIDLHAMSAAFYEALGPAKSPLAFGANGRDATHHSAYGAYELARCVVEGIRAGKLGLVQYLADDMPPFDPAHPDAPESWSIPASPGSTALPLSMRKWAREKCRSSSRRTTRTQRRPAPISMLHPWCQASRDSGIARCSASFHPKDRRWFQPLRVPRSRVPLSHSPGPQSPSCRIKLSFTKSLSGLRAMWPDSMRICRKARPIAPVRSLRASRQDRP